MTLHRFQDLIRREFAPLGGQEITIPPQPDVDPERTLVRLVRREIDSYRQLPTILFHTASSSAPDASIRLGLFGADLRPGVQIHAFGPAGMPTAQEQVTATLERILAASRIEITWAEAGLGRQRAYVAHDSGDESIISCQACSYAAARSWATTQWPAPPGEPEQPTQEIHTPGCDTIAALADYLDIPASKTLKMVFYSVEGDVTCLVIRGDRSIDEGKLARVLGTLWYYASLEHELADIGAVGGYASPIGLDRDRVRVIADPSIRSGRNFVSGANRPDYHIQNVNVPRDFEPGEWADLALVEAGDPCPECGSPLAQQQAFALIERLPAAPCPAEAEYLDTEGKGQPLWMATWHLDLARWMAAVIEDQNDPYGMLWPAPCAPLDVHLVALDTRSEAVTAQADALYAKIQAEGLRVLYDDRDASAGVKFNDADLIGLPLRLTVSKRSAKEGRIEAKWRDSAERYKLDEEQLGAELTRLRER
jgi:prolyl-tRNA synthetase